MTLRFRRLTLTRKDKQVYLDRWGIETRIGSVILHRMTAPDPGRDLHDHPWWFTSIILRGGYREYVMDTQHYAKDITSALSHEVVERDWKAGSIHTIRLDQAHHIDRLFAKPTWTLVIAGPRVRSWGFFTRSGFVDFRDYKEDVLEVKANKDYYEVSKDAS